MSVHLDNFRPNLVVSGMDLTTNATETMDSAFVDKSNIAAKCFCIMKKNSLSSAIASTTVSITIAADDYEPERSHSRDGAGDGDVCIDVVDACERCTAVDVDPLSGQKYRYLCISLTLSSQNIHYQ